MFWLLQMAIPEGLGVKNDFAGIIKSLTNR
jgi:hypothetical protein